MNESNKNIADILSRYAILIFASAQNFWIFYFVFTPLTVYMTYFIVKAFVGGAVLMDNIILINNQLPIELIKACIAGSAYYLLFMLNFSTPNIKAKDRIKMLLLAFSAFLVFNVLRIVFLSVVFLNSVPLFISLHEFFWYFVSTIFVVGIWFFEVWFFRIREIPFYSDMKFFYKHSFLKRK